MCRRRYYTYIFTVIRGALWYVHGKHGVIPRKDIHEFHLRFGISTGKGPNRWQRGGILRRNNGGSRGRG
jgi:hypothetical protein